MKFIKSIFQNHDWIITIIVVILTLIGLLTVYSNSYQATSIINGKGAFEKQLIFCLVGLVLYIVVSKFDYDWLKYREVWIPIYLFVLLLLILVLLFGTKISNVQRWIDIGIFQIQPAEIAKLVILILTSTFISKLYEKLTNRRIFLNLSILFLLTLIYFILIFIQPSAGNALLLLLIFLVTLILSLPSQKSVVVAILIFFLVINIYFKVFNLDFLYTLLNFKEISIFNIDVILLILSGLILLVVILLKVIPLKFVVILITIGILIVPASIGIWESNLIKPYQKTRILSFVNPEITVKENKDALYQINIAKDAIGSGRLLGKGYLSGNLKVPFEYTDFAFTGFAEEFGFVGSSFLLFLFGTLFARIYLISSRATNVFSRLLSIGIGTYLLFHTFFSIGTNIGLVVNTGIPMPFLSYGGTSTIVIYLLLGIAQSISRKALKFDLESKVMLTSKSPWRA